MNLDNLEEIDELGSLLSNIKSGDLFENIKKSTSTRIKIIMWKLLRQLNTTPILNFIPLINSIKDDKEKSIFFCECYETLPKEVSAKIGIQTAKTIKDESYKNEVIEFLLENN